ncbi:MAG: DUF2069 domain-containing protein [Thioalkalivibrionaceae bacterium]
MTAEDPSDPVLQALRHRGQRAARIAQVGFFTLIVILFVAIINVDPATSPIPRTLLVMIALLPLLFPLRGIVASAPRTLSWSTLIALAYWLVGILLVVDSGTRLLGLAILAASMLWFWGAFAAVRIAAKRHALSTTQA